MASVMDESSTGDILVNLSGTQIFQKSTGTFLAEGFTKEQKDILMVYINEHMNIRPVAYPKISPDAMRLLYSISRGVYDFRYTVYEVDIWKVMNSNLSLKQMEIALTLLTKGCYLLDVLPNAASYSDEIYEMFTEPKYVRYFVKHRYNAVFLMKYIKQCEQENTRGSFFYQTLYFLQRDRGIIPKFANGIASFCLGGLYQKLTNCYPK